MAKSVAIPAAGTVKTSVRRQGNVNKRPKDGPKKLSNRRKAPVAKKPLAVPQHLQASVEVKPFSNEILDTTFSKNNLRELVAAVKLATATEVEKNNRLLSDDFIYSVQITSHRVPHVPLRLSRM